MVCGAFTKRVYVGEKNEIEKICSWHTFYGNIHTLPVIGAG